MHKLVILIEPPDDWAAFNDTWPQFLHYAESMPGLRREATSHVDAFLYGDRYYALMHELFFDTLEQAQQAMASEEGRQAGRVLQALSLGHMVLFFADHKEDDLENIRKLKGPAFSPGLPSNLANHDLADRQVRQAAKLDSQARKQARED